jgi:predicted dehydrogenase
MQRKIASGRLGRIHHVRLHSFSAQYLDPESPPHWRQREELSGNNVLALGIYVEVLHRWLGPIKRVFARSHTVYPLRDGYQVRVPDMLAVICEFANGATGVMEFSGVAAHAPSDKLEIFGSQGSLSYDFAKDEICHGTRADRSLQSIQLNAENEGSWRVEEDFIAAVRSHGNLRPRPNFDDGVEYMRVVDAVAESRYRGREVDCY